MPCHGQSLLRLHQFHALAAALRSRAMLKLVTKSLAESLTRLSDQLAYKFWRQKFGNLGKFPFIMMEKCYWGTCEISSNEIIWKKTLQKYCLSWPCA